MSTARTPWHVYFAVFLKQMAPPGIEVTFEVTLTTEPQRGDLLLLHRQDAPRRDGDARAFLGLWPLLRTDTLVELKSLAWPLKKGDLARLQGYGAQYFCAQVDRPLALRDLSLVLILPTRTPTLVDELARMEWTATTLGNGYHRIEGAGYALYVAIMAEVTEAEKDGLLGLFSGRPWTQAQISKSSRSPTWCSAVCRRTTCALSPPTSRRRSAAGLARRPRPDPASRRAACTRRSGASTLRCPRHETRQ